MLIDTDLIIKRFKQLNTELKGGVPYEQKAKKILQKTTRPESLSRGDQAMMTAHPGRGNPLLFQFPASRFGFTPLCTEMDRKGRDPPGAGRRPKTVVRVPRARVLLSQEKRHPIRIYRMPLYNQSFTINQNLYHVT